MKLLYINIVLLIISAFICLLVGGFSPTAFIDSFILLIAVGYCTVISLILKNKRKSENFWHIMHKVSLIAGLFSSITNIIWAMILGFSWGHDFNYMAMLLIHIFVLGIFYGAVLSFITYFIAKWRNQRTN